MTSKDGDRELVVQSAKEFNCVVELSPLKTKTLRAYQNTPTHRNVATSVQLDVQEQSNSKTRQRPRNKFLSSNDTPGHVAGHNQCLDSSESYKKKPQRKVMQKDKQKVI